MTYNLTLTNGQQFKTILDGTVDISTGLALIGANYSGYGQLIANNFVRLLENQANSTQPANPLTGQLWWDSTNKILKVFNGSLFINISGRTISSTSPSNAAIGDQWWNSSTNQLFTFNGASWTLVGPTLPVTQLVSGANVWTVTDTTSTNHFLATLENNGIVVAAINSSPQYVISNSSIGITTVMPGITINPSFEITGTITNATNLSGIPSTSFLRIDSPTSTVPGSLVVQGVNGATVGALNISGNGAPVLSSYETIKLSTPTNSITLNSATGDILVSAAPQVVLGIANKGYVDASIVSSEIAVQANITTAINSLISGSPLTTLAAISNSINNDPAFTVTLESQLLTKANVMSPVFQGAPLAPTPSYGDDSNRIATTASTLTAITNALHADLAEKYESDAIYQPGTVLVFGGSNEVTLSVKYCDPAVAGVVSQTPAYLMNSQLVNGCSIALQGKVECMVIGKAKKGDILVSTNSGMATVLRSQSDWVPGCTIGKCLEDKVIDLPALMFVAVGRF